MVGMFSFEDTQRSVQVCISFFDSLLTHIYGYQKIGASIPFSITFDFKLSQIVQKFSNDMYEKHTILYTTHCIILVQHKYVFLL